MSEEKKTRMKRKEVWPRKRERKEGMKEMEDRRKKGGKQEEKWRRERKGKGG